MANGDVNVTIAVSGTLSSGDAIATVSKTKTFTSVAQIFQRDITVPTGSAPTVLSIGATVAGATLTALQNLVIYNSDPTNYLTVGIIDAGAKSAHFKIKAGEMFVLMDGNIDADDDTGAAFGAFTSIDSITLQANTGAVVAKVIAF
jgi:hypothetical protein